MNNATALRVCNKQGVMVGTIDGRVFTKYVHGSKHMLRQPAAWAIDADVFDRVIVPNALTMKYIDLDTHRVYTCSVNTFITLRKELDRGHNRQYYLELVHWNVK